MVFTIRIEHAFHMTVQSSHNADAREHRWAAERRYQDQGFHCRLPLCRHVLGFRKLCDVGPSIFGGDYLTALPRAFSARCQRDRLIEFPRPIGLHSLAGVCRWHGVSRSNVAVGRFRPLIARPSRQTKVGAASLGYAADDYLCERVDTGVLRWNGSQLPYAAPLDYLCN